MGETVFAVALPIAEPALALLREAGETRVADRNIAGDHDALTDFAHGADALITSLGARLDGPFVDALGPRLRCIANIAVGYDNLAVEEINSRGVVMTNTPGVLTDSTADLTIALMLGITRRIGEAERLVRTGRPWKFELDFMLGSSLDGKLLGVVGLGDIGRAAAASARALAMRIQYFNRGRLAPELEAPLAARRVELAELVETSDVISLHCPLTAETRHLIGAAELAAMKPTAYLINTARGAVVDEAALAAALRSGEIAGAGLDVYENEPDLHPGLLPLENVMLLPHLGSATVEARERMAVLAARNAIEVAAGRPAITPIGRLSQAPAGASGPGAV